jgi:hypothetical protein
MWRPRSLPCVYDIATLVAAQSLTQGRVAYNTAFEQGNGLTPQSYRMLDVDEFQQLYYLPKGCVMDVYK